MTKKGTYIFIFGILSLIVLAFMFGAKEKKSIQQVSQSRESSGTKSSTNSTQQVVPPADKIEVVHFHGTQQCVSCITVGKLALQTIKDKFPDEYASGKIVFKEVNGELPENQAIVNKYQARGSSLFINVIRNGTDEIAEDTTVWRLVSSESQYTSYFEGKLKTLLGK